MAKKTKTHGGKKESHSNQGHADNPSHEKGSNKGNSSRQMDQGTDLSGGALSQGKGWMNEGGQANQEGWLKQSDKSGQDSWNPGIKIDTTPTSLFAKLKNACAPKAVMLTLAFLALGAYLIIVT